MSLAFGMGRGPMWSWFLVGFIILAVGSVIFYGWRQYASAFTARLARWYLLVAAVPCLFLLFDNGVNFPAMAGGVILTLPWSLFIPDLLIDSLGNRALSGMLFICAEMNAVLLYIVAVLSSRRRSSLSGRAI